jgi:lipocalin-like protein
MRALFAALLLTLSSPALTQEAHPLVGTWKLISQQSLVEGEAPQEVFGANPKGYPIATREGRIMVLFTAERRKGGMADAERAALHKSMAAATGKYRVEGSDLIISVDVSWNETWNGTEQRRHIRFDGDRMIADTAPGPSIVHPGKTSVARLVFEREK